MISAAFLRNLFHRRADCHCQDGDAHEQVRAIKAREEAERLAHELRELDVRSVNRRTGGSF